jgi:hypothetical protein
LRSGVDSDALGPSSTEEIVNYRFRKLGTVATLTLALTSIATTPGNAQQFSADVVTTPPKGANTVRVYVGNAKMRIQTLRNGQPEGGMIWDAGRKSTTIVMDKNHSYIGGTNSPILNAVLNGTGAPTMVRLFAPTNSSDPCSDWNNAVLRYQDSTHKAPHFTCHSAGSDVVNGRPAQKWAVTTTDANGTTHAGYAWIDSKLHVVSRSQDKDSRMDLMNIQEGPQPDAVFQIPAGYHQVDESTLLMQLKGGSAAFADMLGAAAKDVGNNAETSTVDAAKDKTNDAVKKKIKSVFHFP